MCAVLPLSFLHQPQLSSIVGTTTLLYKYKRYHTLLSGSIHEYPSVASILCDVSNLYPKRTEYTYS
jgi:hypothetical protein